MAGRVWTDSFLMKEAVEIAIVSGVLTVTQQLVIVEGEGGANDDLVTIAFHADFVKANYQPIVILKAKTGRTITLKHSGGNIRLKAGADFSLTGELTKPLLRMTSSSNFNDF
jgi:hypothetical protein